MRSPSQEPPPWAPASRPDTTAGAADVAELHMVRAVDTGIIDVCILQPGNELGNSPFPQLSLAVQESEYKLNLGKESESKGKQKAS